MFYFPLHPEIRICSKVQVKCTFITSFNSCGAFFFWSVGFRFACATFFAAFFLLHFIVCKCIRKTECVFYLGKMHALKHTESAKATETNAIFFILNFHLFSTFFRQCKNEKKKKRIANTMMKLNYPYLFTLAAAL